MTKLCVLFLVLTLTCFAYKSTLWKLTITKDGDSASRENKVVEIYPTVYSSPVGNLNNHIFTIFKADPLDACTVIAEPNFAKHPTVESYSYLIALDGTIGTCGIRRRIQMAKNAGAKGLIILNDDLDQAIEPYGDYSDNTFLVFVAKKKQYATLLLPDTYISTVISSQNTVKSKPEIQFWLSTLDTKSYQLMAIWDQTTREVPAIAQNVNWKPRYALWGCNSGNFAPGSVCTDDSQYLQSCACRGDFCSPETNYKAADATVKQDIRQKIIFNTNQNKYLAYIIGFKNNCLKTFQKSFYAEDCASSLLMNLGIDHVALDKKVDDFMNKCEGDIYEGLLLDRNRFRELGQFPNAVLDRQPVIYSNKRDFQVQMCKKLGLDQEEGCVKVLKVNTIANFTINVFFFIFIIGGIAAIVGILLLIYRKTIRKQMQKEMKMQVSASVQHYFALSESK